MFTVYICSLNLFLYNWVFLLTGLSRLMNARGWLRHISILFCLSTLVAGRAQCSNVSNVCQCILLLSSQLPLPLDIELITCACDFIQKIYFI